MDVRLSDHLTVSVDEIIAGADVLLDDDGNEIVEMVMCGHCGKTWNDAAVSLLTPTPAGRCPWEYEHENDPARAGHTVDAAHAVGDERV